MSAFMLLNPANARLAVEAKLRGTPMSTYEVDYRRRFGFNDVTKPLPPEHQAAMQRGAEQEAKRNKTEVLAGGLALGGTLAAGLSGVGAGSAASAGGGTASGVGASEAGLASLVGPATGAIEAAPVIGAAGAPLATALPAAAGGAAGAGLASMVGPSTGAVEAAPVIGASGAPTVTGVATGGGPFLPVAGASGGASALAPGGADSSSLGRIMSGTGTMEDYLKIAGQVGPSLFGAYAADKQADAYGDLADRFMSMGAPYRDRLAALYANPSAFLKSPEVSIPVQQGTDALARALSAKVGNPIGSGTALQEIQNYATNTLFGRLGQEKDRLAGFGGLTQYNSAAPSMAGTAVGAERGVYDAIGSGVSNVLNPPKSLADILREIKSIQ